MFCLVLSIFLYRVKHAFSETLTKPCSGMPRVSMKPKLDSLVTENWWPLLLEYVTGTEDCSSKRDGVAMGPTDSPLLC